MAHVEFSEDVLSSQFVFMKIATIIYGYPLNTVFLMSVSATRERKQRTYIP